ncbi:MAG: GNAT family N-acetyltransferase [Porcipelethomonas sp.]
MEHLFKFLDAFIDDSSPEKTEEPHIRVYADKLTAGLFLELYRSVGWQPPGKDQVEMALRHTLVNFTAYDGDKPVGMIRLIGDGGMSFYIKDFAVIPSYQSMGVGSLLIDTLQKYVKDSISDGWSVSLELISTKNAVSFYKKKGFEEQSCECGGSGMLKMIRKIPAWNNME